MNSHKKGLFGLLSYNKPHMWRFYLGCGLIFFSVTVYLFQPYFIKIMLDQYLLVPEPKAEPIIKGSILYLILIICAFITSYYQNIVFQTASQFVIYSLRIKLFHKLRTLSMAFFDRYSPGQIVARLVSDTEQIQLFYSQSLIQLISSGFTLICTIVLMLSINVEISLYCFFVIPCIVITTLIIKGYIKRFYVQYREDFSNMLSLLTENISGMRVVRMFNKEEEQFKKFSTTSSKIKVQAKQEIWYYLWLFHIMELLGDLTLAALIWMGGGAVIQGTLSFGLLYAFISYIRKFFEPIDKIAREITVLQNANAAADRVQNLLEEVSEVSELSEVSEVDDSPSHSIAGEIIFRDVSFGYLPEQMILKDLNFTITPGERVGFVGASGAGKTSIMNLLNRLYDVTSGCIHIDGVDLKQWPINRLRTSVSIISQDVILFSGSILNNIRSFREDISKEAVVDICKRICADSFISKQPYGYETEISNESTVLSLGERQLISMARSLMFSPSILIMDEATAHMDSQTENQMQQAIKDLAKGRTLLVIAHRLSTIREMDKIFVLDQGRIVEMGTHDALMRNNGYYRALYQAADVNLKNKMDVKYEVS